MKLDFVDEEDVGDVVDAVGGDDSDCDIYQFIIHNTRKIDYYMRAWTYTYCT